MSKSSDEGPKLERTHDGILIDDPRIKGISRYFNSFTIRGRANVAKATIGGMFGLYVYMKFKKPSEKETDNNTLTAVKVTESISNSSPSNSVEP
jgi:hypothetical protein